MTDQYWICLQTRFNREFQAESGLSSAGYEVYLPRKYTDMRTRRYRRVAVEALYPTYLFLQVTGGLDGTDLRPVKKIADILRIVRFGGDIAKASDKLIAALKSLENEQGVHMVKSDYTEGDKVRIKSGPLREYEAVIEKLDKNDRAIIRVVSAGRPVNVSLKDLEPAA